MMYSNLDFIVVICSFCVWHLVIPMWGNQNIMSLPIPIDYSHIVLIIAIWPGDRIRRPNTQQLNMVVAMRVYSISAGRTLH